MIRSHTHSGVSAFKDRGSKRVITGVVMLSVKSEDLRFVSSTGFILNAQQSFPTRLDEYTCNRTVEVET